MPRRDEPLTITTEIVVQELRRLGYERMAGFVHRLGDGVVNAERRAQWFHQDAAKLLERLRQYEPAPELRPANRFGKPTEMSDG